jgi:hypothetical protein
MLRERLIDAVEDHLDIAALNKTRELEREDMVTLATMLDGIEND